jgi:2'-5' RNA ligase
MKLMDVVKEDATPKYEYGCVMLYFNFPEMEQMHRMINKEDVYTSDEDGSFGLESEPHTTLLFGLHPEVTDQDITNVLSKHYFSMCSINNASLFENPEYDVLKFDVSGDGLHECNSALTQYPHTTNFPDYHPHLTIGYLKSGTGKKHTELFSNMGYNLTPQYAVYSKPDGSKSKFKIKLK